MKLEQELKMAKRRSLRIIARSGKGHDLSTYSAEIMALLSKNQINTFLTRAEAESLYHVFFMHHPVQDPSGSPNPLFTINFMLEAVYGTPATVENAAKALGGY